MIFLQSPFKLAPSVDLSHQYKGNLAVSLSNTGKNEILSPRRILQVAKSHLM